MRCGMRGRAWGDGVQAACMGRAPTQGCGGQGARAERTENMLYVFVTLDMSKLSP